MTLKDVHNYIDSETTTSGIRSLRLDPERGLRVNGEAVTLRGACIHHGNGPLGAATFARAEEQRVQILKRAGFDALRTSHYPMSTAMLDACDRIGMLVMDEAFDMWTSGKSGFDYSLHFPEWWERDIEAVVAKDFNHPNVIRYSIGNEVPEIGSAVGGVGTPDRREGPCAGPTRYVTNGINNMLAVRADLAGLREQIKQATDEGAGINTLMADVGDVMNTITASELVTRRTEESYACSITDPKMQYYLDQANGVRYRSIPAGISDTTAVSRIGRSSLTRRLAAPGCRRRVLPPTQRCRRLRPEPSALARTPRD
ncbi:glycoside hydrolase family 2 TIM barrel-domain containing protein [Nocardia fluminea]|uniref:glycoside hydrolase family 2 TIM barrel-domain containing protein n=1 Tax=Nocardia fluminea TaxID=134984 RepID=UPI003402164D